MHNLVDKSYGQKNMQAKRVGSVNMQRMQRCSSPRAGKKVFNEMTCESKTSEIVPISGKT